MPSGSPRVPSHRDVFALAIPVMLSNVSTPLLGLVDTAVLGRIPDPAYIGAVAVGSLVFTFVFWAFGFLRMGTTGLTAQALGADDGDEIRAILGRAGAIAVGIGLLLIASKWPIRSIAFSLLDGTPRVESLASAYFDVRIWAAPATLVNYAILGWFMGQQRTDIGFALQLLLNVTNIVLDATFVLVLDWDVVGVAAGTVCAEYLAALVGVVWALRHLRRVSGSWDRERIWSAERLRRTVAVNRDIMLRSLALIFVFVWFMARGAAAGDVVLAANAVLMHFISTSAYFLDGLAFAAEAMVGKAVGASHPEGVRAATRITTWWAAVIAAVLSLIGFTLGTYGVDLITVDEAARATARTYLPWAAAAPLVGVWAFQLDGIFIGATRTVDMRNAMLMATAIFLAAWWALTPYGNHGLWASLHVHYVARIGTLTVYLPRLFRSVRAP